MSSVSKYYFYSKFSLMNPHYLRYYRWLKRNERLSTEKLADLNWAKRRKLLYHAYNNVRYYRKKFEEAGITPDDIKQPEDYSKVPILTKQEIRQNLTDMISTKVNKRFLEYHKSGGSTGVPLRVYHDKRVPTYAAGWRLFERWGVDPWANNAILIRDGRWPPFPKVLYSVVWWPTKSIRLDALTMSIQNVRRFIRAYQKVKPKLVMGYVGAIDYVARFINHFGINIPPAKAIWLTGSPSLNSQRRFIERTFNAPVFDQYGCNEIYWISAECQEHDGLHISNDIRHVEFIDNNGDQCSDGDAGNIIITDLENYAFPFIRYLTDDVGRSLSRHCSCGLPFPLMDSVIGRKSDSIILPDNTVMTGQCFHHIATQFPDDVRQFQYVQNADYSITLSLLLVQPDKDFSSSLRVIEEDLRKKTFNQVPTRVEILDEIPHYGGKLKHIISEVEPPLS